MTVVRAAKVMNTKKSVPHILPPFMSLKTFGSEMKSSDGPASFFEVAQASLAKDGSYVTVLNTNNDVIATIDAAACADFAKIKKGDKLLVWSSMMTMSLPAQTHPEKVVVLP